jgi:hypothetical protein
MKLKITFRDACQPKKKLCTFFVVQQNLWYMTTVIVKNFKYPSKGKAVPLQAWSGPEGSRKLRFPDFMTAQDGGKVVSLMHWPLLPPGNTPGTHFC